MARRIKSYGGRHVTLPIKKKTEIDRLMHYLLYKVDNATSKVKRYQSDRNWFLVLIGLNTAFRAEDLLQLRVKDLKRGFLQIVENKTNKIQLYRLSKKLHDDVLSYISRNTLKDHEYLFTGQKKIIYGQIQHLPITRQQAYKIISDACRAIGIAYTVGIHGLRKTFGYHYILSGGSWQTLSKMYNHEDIIVTQRYVMWDLNDAQKERKKVYIGGVHKGKYSLF